MPPKPKLVLPLSKTQIEKIPLPVNGHRLYYYDERIPGLALVVSGTGSKVFYLIRRVGPKVERMRLGAFPRLSVEQARDAAQRHNGAVAAGVNPADDRRTFRTAPTFGSVFDDYLEAPTRTRDKRVRSKVTSATYRYLFKTHLEPWRERKVTRIARADVERLHLELGRDSGHYLANRVLSLIKCVLEFSAERGDIQVNIAGKIRKFAEHQRDRFLQADEFPRFWQALEAEPNQNARDFLKLALFTGQRKMNILAMKWEDVHFDRGIWVIPQTKTGRHQVPLIGPAIEILKRRHATAEDATYVFPGRHGHLKHPYQAWKHILKASGLAGLRIHDLRRSMGSWQTKTGASLTIVGKTLGHSSPQTTAIYARVDDDPVRKSMAAAAAAMLDAAKPKTKKRRRGGNPK